MENKSTTRKKGKKMKRLIFLALALTSCQYLTPIEEEIPEIIKDVSLIEQAASKK
jgi:hypothetical protein